jgi:Cu(I)/Ag(I) efflux system membrane fusion protein
VLVLALGAVYLATRGKGAPAAMDAAKSSAAATPAGGAGAPVMLTAKEAQRIGVTYATATVGPLTKEVRTVGQVTFDETRVRTITLKIDGFVERLIVNATGQAVAAGQPLLTIYSPMLVTAQEELLLAKRLQRDVSAASGDTRRGADELLSSARRRLAYWDIPADEISEIERSGQVLKTLTLRALFGGYVLEKNVLAGQKVMAGEALYKVADLSTLWVEGEVFEQDVPAVKVGESVQTDFAALPGEHRMGRISYIYPTLNPETRTMRVRVVLANPNLTLKPGMYATIRIAGRARANVLTVPRSAVLSTGERSIVFVHEANGHLTPREVALGTTSDDRIEVLRGVSAGESVVASGTFLVDAESNLGTTLGGMGNMPGMEMTTPPKPVPAGPKSTPAASKPGGMDDMPGMDMTPPPKPVPAAPKPKE